MRHNTGLLERSADDELVQLITRRWDLIHQSHDVDMKLGYTMSTMAWLSGLSHLASGHLLDDLMFLQVHISYIYDDLLMKSCD